MRREGRQHGWVYAYDRTLYGDAKKSYNCFLLGEAPEPKVVRKATAKGAFVKAQRKPTSHSKFTGGAKEKTYFWLLGDEEKGKHSKKGSHKFKHEEMKMYYREASHRAAVQERLDW